MERKTNHYKRVLSVLCYNSYLTVIPKGYHTAYTILIEGVGSKQAEQVYDRLNALEDEIEIARMLIDIFFSKCHQPEKNKEEKIEAHINELIEDGLLSKKV